ncbi:hypothetical protein [Psychrobacillus lasiicapitis]|nr:hypothetical protein [Psychrobacillus lasiicapitis]
MASSLFIKKIRVGMAKQPPRQTKRLRSKGWFRLLVESTFAAYIGTSN